MVHPKSGGLGMMAKELQDWFPEAQISDQPVEKEGYLTLPLASHAVDFAGGG